MSDLAVSTCTVTGCLIISLSPLFQAATKAEARRKILHRFDELWNSITCGTQAIPDGSAQRHISNGRLNLRGLLGRGSRLLEQWPLPWMHMPSADTRATLPAALAFLGLVRPTRVADEFFKSLFVYAAKVLKAEAVGT